MLLQVVLYSHVTAYARINMMRDMKYLQERGARIFYTDTGELIAFFFVFATKCFLYFYRFRHI
jgi:hypothetical protein